MDVLTLGGYIDCYDKAWAQNEYLWVMYMMPPGSYGSFGDTAGKTTSYTNYIRPDYIMGLSKLAGFTQNPVALWIKNQVGKVKTYSDGEFDSLFFVDTDDLEEKEPKEYPLAYHFKDQGMTAFHSDLARVSIFCSVRVE